MSFLRLALPRAVFPRLLPTEIWAQTDKSEPTLTAQQYLGFIVFAADSRS